MNDTEKLVWAAAFALYPIVHTGKGTTGSAIKFANARVRLLRKVREIRNETPDVFNIVDLEMFDEVFRVDVP
jgi:hypothetical protein